MFGFGGGKIFGYHCQVKLTFAQIIFLGMRGQTGQFQFKRIAAVAQIDYRIAAVFGLQAALFFKPESLFIKLQAAGQVGNIKIKMRKFECHIFLLV